MITPRYKEYLNSDDWKNTKKKEHWEWGRTITENGRAYLIEKISLSLGFLLDDDNLRESVSDEL